MLSTLRVSVQAFKAFIEEPDRAKKGSKMRIIIDKLCDIDYLQGANALIGVLSDAVGRVLGVGASSRAMPQLLAQRTSHFHPSQNNSLFANNDADYDQHRMNTGASNGNGNGNGAGNSNVAARLNLANMDIFRNHSVLQPSRLSEMYSSYNSSSQVSDPSKSSQPQPQPQQQSQPQLGHSQWKGPQAQPSAAQRNSANANADITLPSINNLTDRRKILSMMMPDSRGQHYPTMLPNDFSAFNNRMSKDIDTIPIYKGNYLEYQNTYPYVADYSRGSTPSLSQTQFGLNPDSVGALKHFMNRILKLLFLISIGLY